MKNLCALLAGLFIATGQIMWKVAVERSGFKLEISAKPFLSLVLSPHFVFGCVAYCIAIFFWMIQLSKASIAESFAITTGLVILITFAVDFLYFGNKIETANIFGLALVVAGLTMVVNK